jgi:hypothetical protein
VRPEIFGACGAGGDAGASAAAVVNVWSAPNTVPVELDTTSLKWKTVLGARPEIEAVTGAATVSGLICCDVVFKPYAIVVPNCTRAVAGSRSGFEALPFSTAVPAVIELAARVVAAGVATSNAPVSQARPAGRSAPRASVAGQPAFVPASMAGLPGPSAIVATGPPLSDRGPSSGSVST